MSSRSHTDNVIGYACVSCVCTFHSHRFLCMCVSENLTNTQAMPYDHMMPPTSATNTRRPVCIGNTTNFKHKNGADTAHAYGERDPLKWMFFYWTSNAECRPRRRKHSHLAAQRGPHRNSMECYHGGSSRGKQKQRTGTSSSNSVITGIRRCVLPAVRLTASIPATERSFLRSVGASWPDPLLLWRRMLLRSSRVYILRWCAAAGLNALRNGDGSPWQSLFSICR
ncbi:hypothetical protein Tc00.1047053506763.370 [Trypanosoma cruzi]|uniref:Uncharacterized protein n=1 Tax=Trypanosoma cruzi (strain CL Brener) TaxID=353153 RepID=Q4DZB2_TRYCC|nr:hypothetical protein Tc00.1047053506763.370 [Trypanosoma cruzi]EAN97880.1 hypothetical protein Tc00.1047053506763.370 [Trypanosoma cruzi]|eukprot:XP_819731.1 hypothetical protein [Trypanosoma cruzi strain CL Brener]